MIHAIENDIDVDFLRSLKDRLFQERRMTGDDMRDLGNRLTILLDRLVVISEVNGVVFETLPSDFASKK